MKNVEIAIIGAGSAGLSARSVVAKKTNDYVVVDPGPLGTTCARVGCMPSKAFIYAALNFKRTNKKTSYISSRNDTEVNTKKLMTHVRAWRDHFVSGVLSPKENFYKTHFIKGSAKFIDKNTIEVRGQKIRAKSIIIATGSSPRIPEPWQKYKANLIDTDGFFELESIPQKMGVFGLGPLGLELAQALRNLSVEVIGINRSKDLGGLSDSVLQEYATKYFKTIFNLHIEKVNLVGQRNKNLVFKAGEKMHEASLGLCAVGRVPNLVELGLQDIDIELNSDGLPDFDPTTLQVKNSKIFIAGDVNSYKPVLHEASDEGRIAAFNALEKNPKCFLRRTPLKITFCSPNIAVVGQGYKELTNGNVDFITGDASFENQGRAKIMDQNIGMIRIYAKKDDGKLLGAEMIAPSGEHLAHLLALAISSGHTLDTLLLMPFYHPVIEEGLRTALRIASKKTTKQLSYFDMARCKKSVVE